MHVMSTERVSYDSNSKQEFNLAQLNDNTQLKEKEPVFCLLLPLVCKTASATEINSSLPRLYNGLQKTRLCQLFIHHN